MCCCHSSITLSKVYFRRTSAKGVIFQSWFWNVLRRYTNIMTSKGFSIFDECAARFVRLSFQAEECTFSSWGVSKMHTFGSVVSLHKILTTINENSAISKARISVEMDAVKYLKCENNLSCNASFTFYPMLMMH